MDIKGLITLAYDKGLQSEFVGTRCDEDLNATGDDAIEFDEYGRPVGCFDTNPEPFTLFFKPYWYSGQNARRRPNH